MKATLRYECTESGHEQIATVTACGDFNQAGSDIEMKIEFDPDLSDDTSDPTGLLNALFQAFNSFAKCQ